MSREWKWAERMVRRDVAMETHSSDALQARVSMLEHRLRVACVMGMVSLIAVVLLGVAVQNAASQATRIRARDIQLVDAAGRTRIKMAVDDGNQTYFAISDGSDNNVVLVFVNSQGVHASFFHDPGHGSVEILATQGGVSVSASSSKGHMILNPDRVGFYGSGSNPTYASLGVDAGSASASVSGPGGRQLVDLRTSQGLSSVVVSDNDRYSAILGATELKSQSTGTVEKRSAASLVLFDKDDKVIWSAP
jgi:hypothetical protein